MRNSYPDDKFLVNSFLSLPIWTGLTFLAFLLVYNTTFTPVGVLYPFFRSRFLPAEVGVPSVLFSQWSLGLAVLVASVLLVMVLVHFAQKKKSNFRIFLLLVFIVTFVFQYLLLLLVGGSQHLADQTSSVMNGTWVAIDKVFMGNPLFSSADFIGKAKFLFRAPFFSNEAGYSFVGTTHPPGQILIGYGIYWLSGLWADKELAWGIIVALLNNFSLIPLGLVLRDVAEEKWAKWTLVALVFSPTVGIHFMSVFCGIGSLFFMWALYFLVQALKGLDRQDSTVLLWTVLAAISFVFQAQMAYGQGVPILFYSLGFLFLLFRSGVSKRLLYIFGFLSVALVYLLAEYRLSHGNSLWVVRSIKLSREVGDALLEGGRPWFFSQLGNFVVMSAMGGLLFLPSLVLVLRLFFHRNSFLSWLSNSVTRLRVFCFLFFGALTCTLFLFAQRTVRLEVERTWHWYFFCIWPLCFLILKGGQLTHMKIYPEQQRVSFSKKVFFVSLQVIVTLVLAISFQDYY